MFLERKIIGHLQGEKMRHFKAILGWEELEKSVHLYGETHKFTHLVPDLVGEGQFLFFLFLPFLFFPSFLVSKLNFYVSFLFCRPR